MGIDVSAFPFGLSERENEKKKKLFKYKTYFNTNCRRKTIWKKLYVNIFESSEKEFCVSIFSFILF